MSDIVDNDYYLVGWEAINNEEELFNKYKDIYNNKIQGYINEYEKSLINKYQAFGFYYRLL